MTETAITEGRPTPEEAIVTVIQDEAQRNNGALPVRVVKHDKERNSVDVEILIRLFVNGQPREMPNAVDVPIRWLSSAAGHAVTVPILKGALGWITPAGGDVSSWFANATKQADDPEAARFDLSDSVFELGSRPFTDPLPTSAFSDTDGVLSGPWQVGSNAAIEFVALANLVLTELQAIKDWADAHIHSVPGITPGVGSTTSAAPSTPMSDPGSVAASKLRSE